jgi:hypothetical protein
MPPVWADDEEEAMDLSVPGSSGGAAGEPSLPLPPTVRTSARLAGRPVAAAPPKGVTEAPGGIKKPPKATPKPSLPKVAPKAAPKASAGKGGRGVPNRFADLPTEGDGMELPPPSEEEEAPAGGSALPLP